ncbi:YkvA family protein [Mesotoga prima]|uniref:YkvA family protein n=1 Tax=Mesotoga prima TaxID=1184387 RepID=UPI002BE75A55|nr:YkvA family protein [Mesotoga prima]HQC15716.1 YkvA family protein [Mesotoga prima]
MVTQKDAQAQAEDIVGSKDSAFSLVESVMGYLKDPRVRREVREFISRIGLMISMMKDYFSGHYTKIPFNTLVAAIAALVYFVSPVDVIPDFIPVVGFLDDAGIIAIFFMSFNNDIKTYEAWVSEEGEPL